MKKDVFCRGCGNKFSPNKKNRILCEDCKKPKEEVKKSRKIIVKMGLTRWKRIIKCVNRLNKYVACVETLNQID